MHLKTSKSIALCSAANFINAADRIIMPIAIIPMTDQYKWNLHWQGWILSAFAFGYITSQIVGASAGSRFGCKFVMTFAVSLWSLSTVVTPIVASSLPSLILSRFFLGLGEGIGLPTIFDIFAHTVPAEERSRAFCYLTASGTAGQTIASLICPYLPWPWMFYSFGSLGMFWVLLWITCFVEIQNAKDEEIALVISKGHLPDFLANHWRLMKTSRSFHQHSDLVNFFPAYSRNERSAGFEYPSQNFEAVG